VLQPRLEASPRLVAELTRLVDEAKADPQTAAFVTTVADNARVGRITNIGQITGDAHLQPRAIQLRPAAGRIEGPGRLSLSRGWVGWLDMGLSCCRVRRADDTGSGDDRGRSPSSQPAAIIF
jgi:hypothetical protein